MIKNIHENIKTKLKYFIETNKIPHIIFHGESGSGKRSVLEFFLNKIYDNNKKNIKTYVMYVNCAHVKGIRFIRNELKFFAKMNIQKNDNVMFKSIILFNADRLTVDAQSALRRCIELFSHSTRFFIIIENKEKLLKPILSRFCNIFVPIPNINGEYINLHKYNTDALLNKNNSKNELVLKNLISKKNNYKTLKDCIQFIDKLYNKGFSALDIINYVKTMKNIDIIYKYKTLIYFDSIRKQFRNEKVLMLIIFYYIFMRKNNDLENIL